MSYRDRGRYHMSCDREYGVELFASNEDEAVFLTNEPADLD